MSDILIIDLFSKNFENISCDWRGNEHFIRWLFSKLGNFVMLLSKYFDEESNSLCGPYAKYISLHDVFGERL